MPPVPVVRGGSEPHVLWQIGFRPFFLLAGAHASLSVAIWAVRFAGWLPVPGMVDPAWHAREMLSGFTMAVLAGFLFTAVRNWTGRPTPRGRWLMAIVALWLAGRVAAFTPYASLSAVINGAFPMTIAVGIAVPLLASRNRRNFFFVALLAVIALGMLSAQLAPSLDWDLPPAFGLHAVLDVMLIIMAVMGGRVIPMFTASGVRGAVPHKQPSVERVAIGALIALAVLDVLSVAGWPLVAVLVIAACSHAVRWWWWGPHRTLRVPLVWVLHAAYAWIPLHLALRIGSELDVVPAPLAVHALTAGAIGGLTIGMMTRTSKGHTGRRLEADRADIACYGLVLAAAVVRVAGPLLFPAGYVACVLLSALCWSAGFGLFTLRYFGPLTRPRIDGKPG